MRNTGRTTRMLVHARRLSGEGRAVYVIAANAAEARRLGDLHGEPNGGVKFETPGLNGFDWRSLTVRGAHRNCRFLVDHYTAECRAAELRRELEQVEAIAHAYDDPRMRENPDGEHLAPNGRPIDGWPLQQA